MSIVKSLAVFMTLLSLNIAHAAIEAYDFKSEAEERRFQALTGELRCPKCQNQNLAGSDAPIAKDLKDRTYQLLQEGKTDNEIRQYMVERYGDFISYNPPVRSTTYILWFGPFTLLLFVVAILVWRRKKHITPVSKLNTQEAARLATLLKREMGDD
ncbi:MAG: cytochrome c-type biogenesis protein [Agitococcus sp.]